MADAHGDAQRTRHGGNDAGTAYLQFWASAAFRSPGDLPPLVAGALGGLLATWVSFAPCFLWIFLARPTIERVRANKALSGVPGRDHSRRSGRCAQPRHLVRHSPLFRKTVALNGYGLSFDAPVLASVDFWSLALSIAAAIAIFRFRVGVLQTLAAAAWADGAISRGGDLTIRGKEKTMKKAITTLAALGFLSPLPLWRRKSIGLGLTRRSARKPLSSARSINTASRSDLQVALDGVTVKPGLALGGWIAFEPAGHTEMMMGDLVLTETEVTPVMRSLLANGVAVTGVHNHLLRASPSTYYSTSKDMAIR